jgi:uncharacterized RDD family membrane protein YckC
MREYGGFWIRVGAYLIDYIILQIASTVVMVVVMGSVGGFSAGSAPDDTVLTGAVLAMYLVLLVGNWLYYAILESSSWQGTVGKKALGLVVADGHGERISFGRATGRFFAKIISGLILLVGYMMVGWTERKQGLHDMIASTYVYKARSPQELMTNARVFD